MRRGGGGGTSSSGRVNSTSAATFASTLANVEGALAASNQRVVELEAESASYRTVLDAARKQLTAAAAHAATAGDSVALRAALDVECERVKKLELALIEARRRREEEEEGGNNIDNVDGATARVLRAAVSAAEEAVVEATRRADDAERRTHAALTLAETRGRALLASEARRPASTAILTTPTPAPSLIPTPDSGRERTFERERDAARRDAAALSTALASLRVERDEARDALIPTRALIAQLRDALSASQKDVATARQAASDAVAIVSISSRVADAAAAGGGGAVNGAVADVTTTPIHTPRKSLTLSPNTTATPAAVDDDGGLAIYGLATPLPISSYTRESSSMSSSLDAAVLLPTSPLVSSPLSPQFSPTNHHQTVTGFGVDPNNERLRISSPTNVIDQLPTGARTIAVTRAIQAALSALTTLAASGVTGAPAAATAVASVAELLSKATIAHARSSKHSAALVRAAEAELAGMRARLVASDATRERSIAHAARADERTAAVSASVTSLRKKHDAFITGIGRLSRIAHERMYLRLVFCEWKAATARSVATSANDDALAANTRARELQLTSPNPSIFSISPVSKSKEKEEKDGLAMSTPLITARKDFSPPPGSWVSGAEAIERITAAAQEAAREGVERIAHVAAEAEAKAVAHDQSVNDAAATRVAQVETTLSLVRLENETLKKQTTDIEIALIKAIAERDEARVGIVTAVESRDVAFQREIEMLHALDEANARAFTAEFRAATVEADPESAIRAEAAAAERIRVAEQLRDEAKARELKSHADAIDALASREEALRAQAEVVNATQSRDAALSEVLKVCTERDDAKAACDLAVAARIDAIIALEEMTTLHTNAVESVRVTRVALSRVEIERDSALIDVRLSRGDIMNLTNERDTVIAARDEAMRECETATKSRDAAIREAEASDAARIAASGGNESAIIAAARVRGVLASARADRAALLENADVMAREFSRERNELTASLSAVRAMADESNADAATARAEIRVLIDDMATLRLETANATAAIIARNARENAEREVQVEKLRVTTQLKSDAALNSARNEVMNERKIAANAVVASNASLLSVSESALRTEEALAQVQEARSKTEECKKELSLALACIDVAEARASTAINDTVIARANTSSAFIDRDKAIASLAEVQEMLASERKAALLTLASTNEEIARDIAHANSIAVGKATAADIRARNAEAAVASALERAATLNAMIDEARAATAVALLQAATAEGAVNSREQRASAAESAVATARARATASEANAESAEYERKLSEGRARTAEKALADTLLRRSNDERVTVSAPVKAHLSLRVTNLRASISALMAVFINGSESDAEQWRRDMRSSGSSPEPQVAHQEITRGDLSMLLRHPPAVKLNSPVRSPPHETIPLSQTQNNSYIATPIVASRTFAPLRPLIISDIDTSSKVRHNHGVTLIPPPPPPPLAVPTISNIIAVRPMTSVSFFDNDDDFLPSVIRPRL